MSLILAIESAIAGGSLSLIDGDVKIAGWIGSGNVAKAEELLANIDTLFGSIGISKGKLDMVAVSAGPGSFTGIRIGIATALGLKNGLGIPMSSISALRSMIISDKGSLENGEMIGAVPVGRDRVCFQSFRYSEQTVGEVGEVQTLSVVDLVGYLNENSDRRFLLHQVLFDQAHDAPNVINFGSDLAYAIGMACRSEPLSMTKPLFVSKGI